jgi:hypothetical protein
MKASAPISVLRNWIELALGDQLVGHPEPVQDPRSRADAREGAARHQHAPAELQPRDPAGHALAAAVTAEEAFGVNDCAPGNYEAHLRQDLDRECREHPRSSSRRQGWHAYAAVARPPIASALLAW